MARPTDAFRNRISATKAAVNSRSTDRHVFERSTRRHDSSDFPSGKIEKDSGANQRAPLERGMRYQAPKRYLLRRKTCGGRRLRVSDTGSPDSGCRKFRHRRSYAEGGGKRRRRCKARTLECAAE